MELSMKKKLNNDKLSILMKHYGTQISTLFALLVLCIVLSILSPNFLKADNLLTVLLQSSINSVIAVGMTFVIISGGIDLSVGSIVALSTAVMGEMVVNRGLDPFAGMALALGIGLMVGFIQGMIIGSIKIPPFIVTLGGMTIWRGFALEFVQGRNIYGLPEQINWLGSSSLFGIPTAIFFAILIYFIG